MDRESAVEQALIDAYVEFDDDTPAGFPNAELGPDDKPNSLWAHVSVVFGNTTVATYGDLGEDEVTGFMQVDLNIPKGEGTKDILEKASALRAAFPAGRPLTYNGQVTTVLTSTLSPGRFAGGYYRLSVTINFYARMQRRT